ncbi:MAG: rhodanese-like domain-containing protein [Alphaproteobacteria bacterium]
MNHNSEFLKLVDDAKTRIQEVSAEQVAAALLETANTGPTNFDPIRMQEPVGEQPMMPLIVDVREESEYARGHIPGAVHLSKGVIECYIESKIPDKATPMVLYCGGGYRSALAADSLQKMGYGNVLSMAGGWRGWNERGFPVSHDQQ